MPFAATKLCQDPFRLGIGRPTRTVRSRRQNVWSDTKISRQERHRPSGSQRVQDLAAELGWISIWRETTPPCRHTTNSNIPTPENRGIT